MNIEKISKWTLWGLMGIIIVVFALFMFVGFDTPYEENPKQNNPMFTDAVIWLGLILIVIAAVVTIWSAFMQFTKGGSTAKDKGLAGKTGLIATLLFVASIVIGIIVGVANSGETLLINGKSENNPTDIILTDTSIISISILMFVSVVAVVYSMVAKSKK